jgi:hypothetical protein
MNINRHIALVALTIVALATSIGIGQTQPVGPGAGDRGGWRFMGPGMMDRQGFGRMCSPASAGFAEWQVDRLEKLIKPTEAQRAKFDEFKQASVKAAEAVRSACPTSVPVTMVSRMEVMEKRAETMLQAIKIVRPALEGFYATLTDEQKARVDSSSGPHRFWRWREGW